MIQLRYGQISEVSFNMALNKICNEPLPQKVAYSLKKLADRIQQKKKEIAKEYEEAIGTKFGELKDGKLIPENNMFNFKLRGDVEVPAVQAALEEFGTKVVDIDAQMIPAEQLEKIQLTATELHALEPVLQEPGTGPTAQVLPLR